MAYKGKLFEARTISDYKIPIKAQEEMTMFREKEEVDISEGGIDLRIFKRLKIIKTTNKQTNKQTKQQNNNNNNN